jgi:hypothetical protein
VEHSKPEMKKVGNMPGRLAMCIDLVESCIAEKIIPLIDLMIIVCMLLVRIIVFIGDAEVLLKAFPLLWLCIYQS